MVVTTQVLTEEYAPDSDMPFVLSRPTAEPSAAAERLKDRALRESHFFEQLGIHGLDEITMSGHSTMCATYCSERESDLRTDWAWDDCGP